MTKLHIGTSGWVYKHWKEVFYPKDLLQSQWLQYYSAFFDTVEINSSFYRQPTLASVYEWSKKVSFDFNFAVKINRYVTHVKKLNIGPAEISSIFSPYYNFGKKMGPILIQLSPFLVVDIEKAACFFKNLPKNYRYALEPRHESWFHPYVLRILKDNNISLVIADSKKYPHVEVKTADFGYIRFHGSQLHESNYMKEELQFWGQKIMKWSKNWNDVYIYFNNDTNGYAPKNALELKQIMGISNNKSMCINKNNIVNKKEDG